MPRRQPLFRRLTTATRWPVGIALTSWRYMWRTTPMSRSQEEGTWEHDQPPALPDGVELGEIQRPRDGAGPLYRRRYEVTIRDARCTHEQLMDLVTADPDRAAPTEFATFKKLTGEPGVMRVGDEYVVRMPGPWDGPVRVVERAPTCFRLATLEGHLEAGQIRFSAEPADHGRIVFRIESWARGGDALSNLLYDRLRMSKEIQLHMWTSFLEHVVGISGGRREGALRLHTRRVDDIPDVGRPLGDPASLDALRALHDKQLNFDPASDGERTAETGWRVDDYRQPLPPERPGEPEPGGTWERAQELMRDYEFADPAIVRAVYAPDSPLEGRDMLLEASFRGLLKFHFGVRVGGLVDTTCTHEGRDVRVWGWSYQTLQGHLEMGQMDFQVWKWLDDGTVEFRIHVVSRGARIPNPVIRAGFAVFGRHEQVRFAKRACARMACLLAGDEVSSARESVSVRPRGEREAVSA